jgi:anaerobic selenocysteine-containing dehydrogenase
MQEAHAVIPPVGEARPNHEVFADLCGRLGLARPGDPQTAEEISDAVLGSSRRGARLQESLAENRIAFLEEGVAPVQFVDTFPATADRKIHLVPEALDREAPLGLYGYQPEPDTSRYPLALISPSSDRTISSTLGELHRAPVPVAMHPDDAAPRGIRDGDRVRVFNERGSVRCFARVDPGIRSGVVFLPKGIWSHNTESGTTSNALSPDTLADLGGGACFNDARVDIEPARSA